MAFVGNILGGYGSKLSGRYNEALYKQQAALEKRNAEIKKQTFENIALPRLLKAQERNKSTLFVNLLKSGVDVDRVGETPYLMLLEQNIEDAYDVSIARYNSRVTYQNELNRSLLTEARGASEAYKGELAFMTGLAKAGGDIYANRTDYGSLLS